MSTFINTPSEIKFIQNEQEIRDRADLLEVISSVGVKLRKAGNSYKCNCPMHNENTPSFVVTPAKGIFKCYGCGAGGKNAIDFVMQYHELSFRDALIWVAQFYKIEVITEDGGAGERKPIISQRKYTPPPKPVTSYIPTKEMETAFSRSWGSNNFVKYLSTVFNSVSAGRIADMYKLSTSKLWDGANIFWQIDSAGSVRTGHIMLYNPTTGRRSKEEIHEFGWVHKAMKLPDFNLEQCFFGEHLLAEFPEKPVAIVESEKTACIASAYYPMYVWLACVGKNGLGGDGGKSGNPYIKADKCSVLVGRQVVLFPDLKEYARWAIFAGLMKEAGIEATVSDILERFATAEEYKSGFDLADFLTRIPHCEVLAQQFEADLEATPAINEKQVKELLDSYILSGIKAEAARQIISKVFNGGNHISEPLTIAA